MRIQALALQKQIEAEEAEKAAKEAEKAAKEAEEAAKKKEAEKAKQAYLAAIAAMELRTKKLIEQ